MWTLDNVYIVCLMFLFANVNTIESNEYIFDPTITVAILARNSASNLPWFLGSLENLNYPKHRISIW